jgi:hypothetical protein
MFNAIVIVAKRAAGVIGWIYEHTLDLPRELRFQGLEREQVVPEDQAVVEEVVLGDPLARVVGLRGVLEEDARLQARPVLLADPGEFEFLFPWCAHKAGPSC